ncbi:MAG TPA: class I SAM-dependent methyltransferase [Rhizomicrobium sp.]|nr:class I SAM-dependent methyltransferase [Rhizomicrobium sp.]
MDERALPQPMRPHGAVGRVFGFLMERLSAPIYRWVVVQLAPIKPRSYLEIGFGTGELARLVARRLKPQRLAGIDPSELMVASATKKLRPFAKKTQIDLQLGDDTILAGIAGPFDAIAATHSFQFWRDPVATLARIHALLAPGGLFVLVLRKHVSGSVMSWIPNPITKSGDELGGARRALAGAGFHIVADETLKTGSHGIVATRGDEP